MPPAVVEAAVQNAVLLLAFGPSVALQFILLPVTFRHVIFKIRNKKWLYIIGSLVPFLGFLVIYYLAGLPDRLQAAPGDRLDLKQ